MKAGASPSDLCSKDFEQLGFDFGVADLWNIVKNDGFFGQHDRGENRQCDIFAPGNFDFPRKLLAASNN